ncbi:MAG: hypothetical protein ACRDKW_07840 [Actinomycetota bacterium]
MPEERPRAGVGDVRFTVAAIPFGRIDGAAGEDVVIVTVNGRDLIDVVSDVERPLALAAGFTGVNSYAPMGATAVLPPHRHWLGSPVARLSLGGRPAVFTCRCGDWQCGGLLASITVDRDSVVWSDFTTPRALTRDLLGHLAEGRDISRAALGPFRFNRAAYELALENPLRIAWPYPVSDKEAPAAEGGDPGRCRPRTRAVRSGSDSVRADAEPGEDLLSPSSAGGTSLT